MQLHVKQNNQDTHIEGIDSHLNGSPRCMWSVNKTVAQRELTRTAHPRTPRTAEPLLSWVGLEVGRACICCCSCYCCCIVTKHFVSLNFSLGNWHFFSSDFFLHRFSPFLHTFFCVCCCCVAANNFNLNCQLCLPFAVLWVHLSVSIKVQGDLQYNKKKEKK